MCTRSSTSIVNNTVINKTDPEVPGNLTPFIPNSILLSNTDYIESEPYNGLANSLFIFPISNNVINDNQASLDLKKLINQDGSIKLADISKNYMGNLLFKIICNAPSERGRVSLKLYNEGTPETAFIDLISTDFITAKSAGEVKDINIPIPLYVLNDKSINYSTASLIGLIAASFEIYDIKLFINNIYNGKN